MGIGAIEVLDQTAGTFVPMHGLDRLSATDQRQDRQDLYSEPARVIENNWQKNTMAMSDRLANIHHLAQNLLL